MKKWIRRKDHLWAWIRQVTCALLALGSRLPASAALGGTLESVQADQAHMEASIKISYGRAYTVHEMTGQTRTTVREYVSPAGKVFGVAWQGPFIPDLRQILGSYFEQYSQAAKAERESHVGRRSLNLQEPGLVMQSSGHMRAYSGWAYDPSLLPAGVSAAEIR
jgi:hypothetical protein